MQLNYKYFKQLIFLIIVANGVGMLFPCLKSTFSPYYGTIAKHIAMTGNFSDLVFSGHDWLDKPHFPFWITALFFKIFGINSFAYIMPGFIFNLIGIFYTYKLGELLYSKEVGLLAALFTLTSLHIMLSSIDIRAEAYLIGQIMPAVYYWLKYNNTPKIKYLFFGAIFTALSLMTKGLFTLITITSGIFALWIWQKQFYNFIRPKWLIALILVFIFILPELISLYLQFDSQPNKIVFEHTHVSGIRWFFWDSQFGRFFNTGPISVTSTEKARYLFFVYTMLWAYLPWWPIFLSSLYSTFKKVSFAAIFLLASFFITFIIFSLTKFQIDHYTNILFPFASIISANWLYARFSKLVNLEGYLKFIYWVEMSIAILILTITIGLNFLILHGIYQVIIGILAVLLIFAIIKLRNTRYLVKITTIPSLVLALFFIFAMFVNGVEYAKYDAGYQIAKYLDQKNNIQIIGYDLDLLSLDFNVHKPFSYFSSEDYKHKNPQKHFTDLVNSIHSPVTTYIVTEDKNSQIVKNTLKNSIVEKQFLGSSIETFLHGILNKKQLHEELTTYDVIKINPSIK